MLCIGYDIGGTKCAVSLGRVEGERMKILDKAQFPTQGAPEDVLSQMADCAEGLLKKRGLSFRDVASAGISCGGPLDSRRGVVLCPPNLPGWENIPLTEMLSEKYGVPTFIQNDANACALVEWKLGAGRGTQDMIFLTMGTGMGAGVIANGRLLCGHNDMGGEVGHLRLAEDGPWGFGKAGSFEGFASGGGMLRHAQQITQEKIRQGQQPKWIQDGHGLDELTPQLMASYARSGDPDAIDFFNYTGRMLGRGISILVDAFNPERVIIGSIFMRCEDLLRAPMEEELRKEAIPFSLEGFEVVPAETGESLGDYASIMVALYAMNIDPLQASRREKKSVLRHYDRLFERYPALESCRESVFKAYDMLRVCYQNGGKLLLVGNGGSCADCEHIVGELMKGFWLKRPLDEARRAKIRALTEEYLPGTAELLQQGLPAIALTRHSALSTAVQNDLDPSLSAAQQVVGYGRSGDVILGISTSGNAKNVALAVATGKALGLKALGMTGERGGKLAELCDCTIRVPAQSPADVQEYHLPVYHTLCAMLESNFFEDGDADS